MLLSLAANSPFFLLPFVSAASRSFLAFFSNLCLLLSSTSRAFAAFFVSFLCGEAEVLPPPVSKFEVPVSDTV